MNRRDFFTLIGGTALARPLAARAQVPEKKEPEKKEPEKTDSEKIARIGVLWRAGSAEKEGTSFRSLVKGFSELGYVEGRNVMLEHRFANELPDRFKSLADELVASNVDVLIGVGSSAAPYAKNATTTIPVVFTLVADPIGSKLVDSLQQPGGNVTGLSSFSPDLFGKHLQILKEIIPSLARVALLVNPNDESSRLFMDGLQAAAAELGLTSQNFEWRTTNDLGPAFDAMKRAGIQVFTSNPDGLAFAQRALIGQIALARNLPLSVWSKEALKPGAFMSYAVDQDAICQRTAVFADKILKGAKPGELPVELPTKTELFINLKIAKTFGLDVPAQVRQVANSVSD
jgi:putative tryptophan/tyrosine transport system substrate-binding protein